MNQSIKKYLKINLFLLIFFLGFLFVGPKMNQAQVLAGDIQVETFDKSFSSDGSTETLSNDVGSTASAFVLNTTARRTSAGDSAVGSPMWDDFSAGVRLTATDTLTFYRPAAGAGTIRMMGEVWRYTGSAGGAHEFIKRWSGELTIASANTYTDQTVSGISDANDVVCFVTGIEISEANTTTGDRALATARMTSSSNLRVERGDTGSDVVVHVECVEFTGSAWTIGHFDSGDINALNSVDATIYPNYDFTGTAVTISDWTTAFIWADMYGDRGTNNYNLEDTWFVVVPKDADEVTVDLDDTANCGTVYGYVIQNNSLDVERETASKTIPAGLDTSLTDPSNVTTADERSIAEWYVFSDGGGAAYARGAVTAKLNGATVEAWVHRSGNAGTYRYAGIDLSGLISGITISGTSNLGSGTVAVAVNSSLSVGSTAAIGSGTWSISSVSVNSGNVVTVWIDGAADSDESTAITKYDGTGNITGMVLNQHVLSIGSDDNASLTVTNLGQYDNDQDEDIMHSANSSTLNVDDDNAYSDEKINILANNTLTIGSSETLTTHDVAINGTLTSSGNATYNVSGSWDNNSVFTADTSTVYFNASSGTETIDSSGSTTSIFYNLQHTGAGTLQLTTALDVNGDFSQTSGTFDCNSQNQNFTGAFSLSDSTTYTKGGALTFDGSGSATITDANSTKQNLGTVSVDGSTKTLNLGSSITVDKLSLGADDTLGLGSSGYTLLLKGSGTSTSRPFLINTGGTLNEGTNSTVKFDTNTGPTEIQAETYYHLSLQPASAGGPTYRLGTGSSQTINITGNLTVGDGTNATTIDWDNYDPALNIGLNLTLNNNSTWTKSSSGTLTFNGSSLGLLADNNIISPQDLGTVVVDGSSKSLATNSNIRLTTLNIGADDELDISSDTLMILGSGTPLVKSGTLTVPNSTVSYTGISPTNITTTAYNNLHVGVLPPYDSTTYSLTGNLTGSNSLTGNLNIGAAILDTTSNDYDITLAGNWYNGETFTANESIVTFNAGSTGKTIEAGSSSFYDVVFNSSTGGWTIQTNNLTAHDFTVTDTAGSGLTINGVTVEVQGTYSIADAETSNTTWTSATLYLNSASSYTVGSKTQSAETYNTLQVGADTDIRLWNSTANTFTVNASGSLYSQDHANTNGDVYIWGDYHTQTNDYWSYATDFDGTNISGGSERQVDVRVDPSSSITVDSSDTLAAVGTSGNRTTVSRQGASGGYPITVASGGTINFQYTDFDYLEGTTGLNIQSGATVTSLDYTDFDNLVGSAATNDAYITVASAVIGSGTKTISGVNFDNTDASVDFNVNRTGTDDTGYWDFTSSTGSFDGESYDGDDGTNEADPGMLRWDDSSSGVNSAPSAPTSLLTENATNPTVSDTTPEFSAVYNDADSGDIANKYQIQVDDDPAFGSTLWDSGSSGTAMTNCTESNRCSQISYSGSALNEDTIYYWRIKFWDDDNEEGSWSTESAWFKILTTSDTRFRDLRLRDVQIKPNN